MQASEIVLGVSGSIDLIFINSGVDGGYVFAYKTHAKNLFLERMPQVCLSRLARLTIMRTMAYLWIKQYLKIQARLSISVLSIQQLL